MDFSNTYKTFQKNQETIDSLSKQNTSIIKTILEKINNKSFKITNSDRIGGNQVDDFIRYTFNPDHFPKDSSWDLFRYEQTSTRDALLKDYKKLQDQTYTLSYQKDTTRAGKTKVYKLTMTFSSDYYQQYKKLANSYANAIIHSRVNSYTEEDRINLEENFLKRCLEPAFFIKDLSLYPGKTRDNRFEMVIGPDFSAKVDITNTSASALVYLSEIELKNIAMAFLLGDLKVI